METETIELRIARAKDLRRMYQYHLDTVFPMYQNYGLDKELRSIVSIAQTEIQSLNNLIYVLEATNGNNPPQTTCTA